MPKNKDCSDLRSYRHLRLRKKIAGNKEMPRFSVFRSLKQIYVQIIDDLDGKTLVSANSLEPEIKKIRSKIEKAKEVGISAAKKALEKGIKQVVFDRGGYKYHGSIASLAEGARESGLEF
ncbi:MAG: 50S ribosomal protein L18 [Armatimonadetes bacterium]|nr:50S ribosomal protein L18 [Armatimonadota bacterium]